MRPTPTVGSLRPVVIWMAASAIPTAWLEIVRLAASSPFTWGGLAARWAFVACLLLASWCTRPQPDGESHSVWPKSAILVAVASGFAAIYYAASGATAAAVPIVASVYIVLLGLERALTGGGSIFWRWGARAFIVVLGGAVPLILVQFETRFSEEEFLTILLGLALGVFTALLVMAQAILARLGPGPAHSGVRISRRWLGLALAAATLMGVGVTVRAYQRSFYPHQVPGFEGISRDSPFLCGTAQPVPQIYAGEETFQRLLAQVATSPYAGTPEYGMLAVGTGDRQWAEVFRDSILMEAREGRFTEPAHTVKSAQFEAALRIYYLSVVRDTYPDLFSPEEVVLLHRWTADINHRAQTVELVDWMYGLAFTKWPEGPYENQENGAGLLAVLETEGYSAPELSAANLDYLERNRRGWVARFRNTDDTLIYQPEWIVNAYLQSLYTGESPAENVALSFEWLLLQALPDGAPMGYNHPYQPSLAGSAYLGAILQQDPRLVWLAGRALDYAATRGTPLAAQPGAEQAILAQGQPPGLGSCLLYGDSGLPNQIGPLAPDKIVFRDGWSEDDVYLLLNLRFTGWHRYKATNTVTLVYKNGPLASDVEEGKAFNWLPEGRSVFRDKRIPRENLNGLLIPRRGLDALTYYLTGVGQPWAQDPPPYAEVIAFETGEELDWSHTRLGDWGGWQHDRWIYFYHQGGPLVVVDSARGPANSQASLAWHLFGDGPSPDGRIRLESDGEAAEVILLAKDRAWSTQDMPGRTAGDDFQDMIYYSPVGGQLQAAAIFLMGEWVGAEVSVDQEWRDLEIIQGDARFTVPLSSGE